MYISVIIPTLNRARFLSKALDSLVEQTCRPDSFEVIVVDNGSTDETAMICQDFKNKFHRFSYHFDSRPGLHIGRHVGWKNAQGDILIFGDDDIRAFPTWIEGVAESFRDSNVALVGGKILPEFESPPPVWVESLWKMTPWGRVLGYYSLIDFGDEIKEISPNYVWGCNFSIRKKILEECGGFHPDGMPRKLLRFRGDGETAVSDRILAAKKKVLYNPKTSVYHWVASDRMTIDYLYQRSYAQGISDSFTMIRRCGRRASINSLKKLIKLFVGKHLIVMRNRFAGNPKDSKVVKAMASGHADGFFYHQLEVLRDGKLFEWVMKENFLLVGDSDNSQGHS